MSVKLRVEVEHVVASITLDNAWTPELLQTLLRECGDEVVRVCLALGTDATEAETDTDQE